MADKTIKVGTTVSFQDTSNETTATYIWDFGDGTPSTVVKNPSHLYGTLGLYTVTHSVTNTCGTTNCTPKTIDVVAELPSGGGSSAIMIMGAAVLGFLMMAKK